MVFVGYEAQGGLLIISILVTIIVYLKFSISGIPRFRVMFLLFFCHIVWILSYCLSLFDESSVHALLWGMMSFLGMAASIFMLFISFYEILTSPGM
jgi:hypothetical protein